MRGIGWTGRKVLDAYGRDELNEKGERLLIHATDNKLALLNTYYATPARGIAYTFQSPNRGKTQYRLDYILTRQVDRRLVRNATVQTPPRDNLVSGNIRLLGRIAPNRPKRVIKNRRAIDLPRLMADPHFRMNFQNAIAAKLASPTPGTNAGSKLHGLITERDATVKCGRHSASYSAQTRTEGLVCDRGDESGVERTMAGYGRREETIPFCSKRSWSTTNLEGDHQTAETHAGGSCSEVLRRLRLPTRRAYPRR